MTEYDEAELIVTLKQAEEDPTSLDSETSRALIAATPDDLLDKLLKNREVRMTLAARIMDLPRKKWALPAEVRPSTFAGASIITHNLHQHGIHPE